MASVNLDVAQRLDITCRKGDTFNLVLDFNQDMSGTWAIKVLETDESTGNSLVTFDTVSVTTNDDGVANAKVTITATATNMSTVSSGTYVYDLQLTSSGVVTTYLYGLFKVNEDVTA